MDDDRPCYKVQHLRLAGNPSDPRTGLRPRPALTNSTLRSLKSGSLETGLRVTFLMAKSF